MPRYLSPQSRHLLVWLPRQSRKGFLHSAKSTTKTIQIQQGITPLTLPKLSWFISAGTPDGAHRNLSLPWTTAGMRVTRELQSHIPAQRHHSRRCAINFTPIQKCRIQYHYKQRTPVTFLSMFHAAFTSGFILNTRPKWVASKKYPQKGGWWRKWRQHRKQSTKRVFLRFARIQFTTQKASLKGFKVQTTRIQNSYPTVHIQV